MKMERETTLDEWAVQIRNASGKRDKILEPFIKAVDEAGVPNMEWDTRGSASSLAEAAMNVLKTGKRSRRNILMIKMKTLDGYAVLVDVDDYGGNLFVSWKVIFSRFMMSWVKGYAVEVGWINPMRLNSSKSRDLTMLKMTTQDALKAVIKNFERGADENFSEEDERSRGIDTISIPS